MRKYLAPTPIIDCDHQSIQTFAHDVAGSEAGLVDRAARIFLAVRDGIRYDPYTPFYLPEHYRASNVLKRGRGFCVPKASLLCAAGRALGIPARVGFAAVRNHLVTRQLLEFIGTDLFVFHGFVEFYLEEKWVKATPAFNAELCRRHGVPPLEFDGLHDALFQAYNNENQRFMEYVEDLGIYDDIPFDEIMRGFERVYGKDRLTLWIKMFEEKGEDSLRDFAKEEVVTP